MQDNNLIELGKKIRAIRKEKGISQERLAFLSGTDRSYMGRIERGEKNISVTKIYQICNALNISPKELFD
ncbi:helix-turn-helix domain-containing protein [Thalassotalea agariperforans]